MFLIRGETIYTTDLLDDKGVYKKMETTQFKDSVVAMSLEILRIIAIFSNKTNISNKNTGI